MGNKIEKALQYYRENKFSLAKCAEMAEVTIEEFIVYLGEQKISIFSFEKEDIANA
ncbi:UPF0175 family protein [Tissierella pigra]|uniref:UPF0175 family protein n=1 Tax=Tissierella pigra TaxID=2607614 RepID=UPI001C11C9FA|nr:UPF0175 family protein [Tissierella pigra]MBU5428181.1 UPF0175 family protein [Tissierella pigra]